MRLQYQDFVDQETEIIALGPDGQNAFQRFWKEHQMPFIGMADIRSRIADQYCQEVNLLKLGRMPALFIIDRSGAIRYVHYGEAMQDTSDNNEILKVLDQINAEESDIL